MLKKFVATTTALLIGVGLSLAAVGAPAYAHSSGGSGSHGDHHSPPPTTTPDATASTKVTPPTCRSGATLSLQAVNATWQDDAGHAVKSVAPGSGDFSLTAVATAGHTFVDGSPTQSFTGTLPPKLPASDPSCAPPSKPKASVEIGDCTVGDHGASVAISFFFDNRGSKTAVTFTIPALGITKVVPAGETALVTGYSVGKAGATYVVYADGCELTTLCVKGVPGCVVTPGDPKPQPALCVEGKVTGGSIWVDLKTGLIYSIDGPGVHISPVTLATNAVPPGVYTVSVAAAPGFILTGDDNWPFTLTVKGPSSCIAPSLTGSVATGVCLNNSPWIQFNVTLTDPDKQATNHSASLIMDDGSNNVSVPLSDLTDNHNGTWTATGSVLWPGASVDSAGKANGWPGWTLSGGVWTSTPNSNYGWTRNITHATLKVNPELVVDIVYPPATPTCNTNPPTAPTLTGSVATGVCLSNSPWIKFNVTLTDPDKQATNHSASLIMDDGSNSVTVPLADLTDNHNGTWTATGSVLWPGASVDGAGKANGWPGWTLSGGVWTSTPDANYGWTRNITHATLKVNPELVVDIVYPPATPTCNTNPPTAPTLTGSTVTGTCIADSPWISYNVTMTDPDNQADNHTASLILTDGTHTTTITLGALQPGPNGTWTLSGRALWPGANVDLDGKADGWPGWEFLNGQWAQTADPAFFGWTRSITTATLSVNPSMTVDLIYPPATPNCNLTPPDLPTDALIPTNATWTDEYCTAQGTFAGSITVGQVAGVNYLGFTNYFLDGVPMTKATTFLPAGTYHVTATVKDPTDSLDGPSSWDITIAGVDQTQCAELKTLALTGSDPSAGFLFGGALLLIGVAIGAARIIRRRLNED